MSAAVAFTRATISALSASVRVTGPLADLMYSVLPSILSIVPATRWVCCCAHAVETANTAAKEGAAQITILLILGPQRGYPGGGATPRQIGNGGVFQGTGATANARLRGVRRGAPNQPPTAAVSQSR